jgi:nicotinate-nucleotide adenylyltransferase
MKRGIFGGTFNPLHNGHIDVITYIRNLNIVDEIIVVPSGQPFHKNCILLNKLDRYVMVAYTLGDMDVLKNNSFSLSTFEVDSDVPNETYDLLKHLDHEYNLDDELFFILGSDSFFTIHEWQQYKNFSSYIDGLIVMIREDQYDSDKYSSYLLDKFGPGYASIDHPDCVEMFENAESGDPDIYIIETPKTNISSTMIRSMITEGKDISKLVPDTVSSYLKLKGII